jgi:hypothetical protein
LLLTKTEPRPRTHRGDWKLRHPIWFGAGDRSQRGWEPKDSSNHPFSEQLIERNLACKIDDEPFNASKHTHREYPRRRARRDQSGVSTPLDQPGELGDDASPGIFDGSPDRVVLTTELDTQDHMNPRDVTTAENRVIPGHRDEGLDGIISIGDQGSHDGPPGLFDPGDHGKGELLLACELVVQRPAAIAGLGGDAFER